MRALAIDAGSAAAVASRRAEAVGRWILSLDPRVVVGAALAAQWLLVAGLALVVRHNAWVYYQGGDQLWYYTTAWLFGHGHFPQPLVGYLWSFLLAPFALVAGPNLVSALPAILVLDVLVLLPVGLLALYGTARLIAGRAFAYWVLLLWLIVPLIGIRFANPGYHQRFTELLLPQAFGLSAMADFPTMIAALVSAYFCARVLFVERPATLDAVAAGVAAGAAIAIKPSTALFLAGPLLAFAVARRLRLAGVFIAALLPAVLTLMLWKWRGYGYLPLLHASTSVRSATAAGDVVALNLPNYTHFDWQHFTSQLDLLREHFWSGRLIEWLIVAGVIGASLRSRVLGAFAGAWFLAFALVKSGASEASIEDGNLLRILIPAYPAFVLLLASLPFLLPGFARTRIATRRAVSPHISRRAAFGAIGAGILLTAVAPAALIAASSPANGPDPLAAIVQQPPVPARVSIGLTARSTASGIALSWMPQHPAGGQVFYHVYRSGGTGPSIACDTASPAQLCSFAATDLGTTQSAAYLDRGVPAGNWEYRVGVAANWLNDPAKGDVYLLSTPVTIRR